MTKQCFVICPLGKDGSATRKKADDVFDLLIVPALERFGYDVVRSDMIPGSNTITSEIISLVQESDLCIIDLTDHNPNVFYECGRRHENGKPFIQLCSHEQDIPFDLAGIRTIKYDLSDPRSTRKAVLMIQDYVREIEKGQFADRASGASLSTIIESLNRIERRLSRVETGRAVQIAGAEGTQIDFFRNPREVFQEAYMKGDLQTVVSLLPRLEAVYGYSPTLIAAAGLVAKAGESVGESILLKILQSNSNTLDGSDYKACVTALVQYYVATDREKEGLGTLRPRLEELAKNESYDAADRAYLLNQVGMLAHGAEEYELAMSKVDEALELLPMEASYLYNKSIISEKLGLRQQAIKLAEQAVSSGNEPDDDHLAHLVELYSDAGLSEKRDEVLKRLKAVNPHRATFLMKQYN